MNKVLTKDVHNWLMYVGKQLQIINSNKINSVNVMQLSPLQYCSTVSMAHLLSASQRIRAEPVLSLSWGHQPCHRYTSWKLSTRNNAAGEKNHRTTSDYFEHFLGDVCMYVFRGFRPHQAVAHCTGLPAGKAVSWPGLVLETDGRTRLPQTLRKCCSTRKAAGWSWIYLDLKQKSTRNKKYSFSKPSWVSRPNANI